MLFICCCVSCQSETLAKSVKCCCAAHIWVYRERLDRFKVCRRHEDTHTYTNFAMINSLCGDRWRWFAKIKRQKPNATWLMVVYLHFKGNILNVKSKWLNIHTCAMWHARQTTGHLICISNWNERTKYRALKCGSNVDGATHYFAIKQRDKALNYTRQPIHSLHHNRQ